MCSLWWCVSCGLFSDEKTHACAAMQIQRESECIDPRLNRAQFMRYMYGLDKEMYDWICWAAPQIQIPYKEQILLILDSHLSETPASRIIRRMRCKPPGHHDKYCNYTGPEVQNIQLWVGLSFNETASMRGSRLLTCAQSWFFTPYSAFVWLLCGATLLCCVTRIGCPKSSLSWLLWKTWWEVPKVRIM